MKKTSIFCVLLIQIRLLSLAHAQSSDIPAYKEAGLPYLQNFSAKDYNAHQQNWAIAQDERGMMYFGNTAGVLEYDGVSWRLISTPNKSVVRSLAVDSSGRVYVGAHGAFGYLAPDSIGQMQYNSLLDHVQPEDRKFNNVWKVHASPKGIYFRTNTHLFLWLNNRMQVWKPCTEFHRSFWVHDTFYIREWEVGLLQMADDSLQLVRDGEKFADDRVDVMLPFGDEKVLLGTRTQGLFLFDGAFIQPFSTEADLFLRENQLYEGVILSDGTFALATIRGGVAIIDRQGHFLQTLDKKAGLQDNTVWSASTDRQGALWLTLNNGLARIETPAPFSIYSERLGIKGSVESIQRHRGRLYAATGLGVYYLTPSAAAGTPPVFQAVSGIATQAWSLLSAGKTLLAATTRGVYRIEKNRAMQVTDLLSFFLYRSKRDSNRVYIGLADGLGMLQFVNGKWSFAGRLPGIPEEVRSIVEDETGTLWLGSQFQGVLQVKMPSLEFPLDTEEPELQVERYGQANDLPNGEVNVYLVNRRVLFGTSKGLRRFDPLSRSFLPDSTFGETVADTSYAVHRVIEDTRGRVWIEIGKQNKIKMGVLLPQQEGTYMWHNIPLLRMADFLPVWAIYPDRGRGDVVWFGGTGGLVRYNTSISKDYNIDYSALVRRVKVNGDSLIFGGAPVDDRNRERSPSFPSLEYPNNALRFEYAAPTYDDPSANQFQYFLEGFDEGWSDWTEETKKEYTNLPEGRYGFRVQAKNIYQHLSSEGVFAFIILPPWYRTWWAYGFYVLVFGTLVYGLVQFQVSRVRIREREKARLKEAEIIEHQVRQSELRFRSVAQSANDAIISADSTGNIIFWNKCAQTIFGYSEKEALGQSLTNLMPERHKEPHEKALQRFFSTGQSRIIGQVVELHGMRKDGTEFPLDLTLASWQTDEGTFVTGIIRDITKRKQEQEELEKTQMQLFQSEKLASLGKLTAGIAHEINTPIGALKSNADVTTRCIAKLEEILENSKTSTDVTNGGGYQKFLNILRENSRVSSTATDRIAKLLSSLKNFTRLDEAELQMVDLHEGIESTLTLIEHEVRDQISVVKEYGELPEIYCCPSEINQVFMSLLRNALQAIEQEGVITIKTSIDKENVCVKISDTGKGIPAEKLKTLFDFSFTTKDARVGMGMGLIAAYNIIQRHKGELNVESEVSNGSAFTIILPTGLGKTLETT